MRWKATEFEYRHQTLIHLLIVAISFLAYLIDRNDIVWAFVQRQSHQSFWNVYFLHWQRYSSVFPPQYVLGLALILTVLSPDI